MIQRVFIRIFVLKKRKKTFIFIQSGKVCRIPNTKNKTFRFTECKIITKKIYLGRSSIKKQKMKPKLNQKA
ncbi:hypothetical protein BOW55_00595 [Flavobacterium sp. YO12]|nr:hypothetical protein BOW55_00595 [Flavobacterium sp. YO12]